MNSITDHEIVRQLDRVLASANFLHSFVLAKFLKHIVQETVAGRGHELKEYTIGVAALKKDPDFNPQIDSIVRIHAGRLRRALRDYYQTEGVTDPITILVPKGSYVPVFEINAVENLIMLPDTPYNELDSALKVPVKELAHPHTTILTRSEGKPSIIVAPFKVIASEHVEVHSSLSEYLSSELTKFEDLVVMSGEMDSHASRFADYALRGTIYIANRRMRIFVYLQGRDGRQYWANTFTMAFEDLWQMEDEVVARTVAAVAGINGVISRVEALRMTLHLVDENHRPLSYWYKQHVNHFEPGKTRAARIYYEDVLTRMPDNALAAAYLSEIICRQAFFESNRDKSPLLLRALDLAREALLTDPTCQQAYHAMAMITMVLGRTDECLRYVEKGLALNPNSVDFQAGVGSILIYLGKYDRGMEFLEHALELLPDPSWGHLLSLAIHAFHKGAYRESLRWLEQSKVDTFWVLLVRAAAAANAGEQDIAREALATFRLKYPALNPDDKSLIDDLFVQREIAHAIHKALLRLGSLPLYVSENKPVRYEKKRKLSL